MFAKFAFLLQNCPYLLVPKIRGKLTIMPERILSTPSLNFHKFNLNWVFDFCYKTSDKSINFSVITMRNSSFWVSWSFCSCPCWDIAQAMWYPLPFPNLQLRAWWRYCMINVASHRSWYWTSDTKIFFFLSTTSMTPYLQRRESPLFSWALLSLTFCSQWTTGFGSSSPW